MNQRRVFFFLLLIANLGLSGCLRPLSWPVDTTAAIPLRYGPPTNVGFQLDTAAPGVSANHAIKFHIQSGDLETYQVVVTYPPAFTFNGFLALGAANTEVGDYLVDFDSNGSGSTDFMIPVLSIDNNTAYADRDINGSYNSTLDSKLMYTNPGGAHVIMITLPNGGDGNPMSKAGPFDEGLTAVVNAGLLTNPTTPGIYTVNLMFTSVDPDTDNADDSAGDPPMVLTYCKDLGITAPGNATPSVPLLASPADGATGLSTNTTLEWAKSTDADGDPVSYRVLVWQGGPENVTGCNPATVVASATPSPPLKLAGITMSFALFGVVSFVGFGNRRVGLAAAILLVVAAAAFVACGGGGGSGSGAGSGGSGSPNNASFSPAGLASGTTYSWKVMADDGKGGMSESATRTFTTQ